MVFAILLALLIVRNGLLEIISSRDKELNVGRDGPSYSGFRAAITADPMEVCLPQMTSGNDGGITRLIVGDLGGEGVQYGY